MDLKENAKLWVWFGSAGGQGGGGCWREIEGEKKITLLGCFWSPGKALTNPSVLMLEVVVFT